MQARLITEQLSPSGVWYGIRRRHVTIAKTARRIIVTSGDKEFRGRKFHLDTGVLPTSGKHQIRFRIEEGDNVTLCKGDRVRVYQMPLTDEDLEGTATLGRFIDRGQDGENWTVDFADGCGSAWRRLVRPQHLLHGGEAEVRP